MPKLRIGPQLALKQGSLTAKRSDTISPMIADEHYPTLLIDSTSENCWVGVVTSTTRVEREQPGRSSEVLALLAIELLQSCNLGVCDLKRIIVMTGPGSFTGIRAALAFCSGVTLATGVAVFGVSVFQVGAALARTIPGNYLLRLTANKNEDFLLSLYASHAGDMRSDWLPKTVKRECLCEEILICGEGLKDSYTVVCLDCGPGPLRANRLQGMLEAGSNIALRGPAEAFYGKPVHAKTLVERGLAATFIP